MMFHVKHSDTQMSELEYIMSNALLLGVELDDVAAGALIRHIDLLLEANTKVNLTAIRDREQAIRLHALDSIAVIPYIREMPAGAVADLGAGGGFPGIPVAIVTGRQITLIESIKKKASFLQEAVDALRLNGICSVSAVRAEEEAIRRPEFYSVVLARALSSLPSLLELASPLLRPDGLLVAMKGRLDDQEIEAGRTASRILGMSEQKVERYLLPDGDDARSMAVYRKTGVSSLKLPRNPGMAQKKPIV